MENKDQLQDEDFTVIEAPFEADEEGPFLFISYAHKSRKEVFTSIRKIYEKGWRIWYDEGLVIGEDYYGSLKKHIEDCAAFLLYVTADALKSTFVMENEIPFARELGKPIVVCFMDKALTLDLGEEAVVTDEAGLEAALQGLDFLDPGAPREAKGHTIRTRIPPVDNEYDYEVCEGGVRLFTYHGTDREVFIPSEYPPFSGMSVVELGWGTFDRDMRVRTVHVPESVRKIDWDAFSAARQILDIYVPSSVETVPRFGIVSRRIHCAKDSAAYKAVLKHNEDYLEAADPSVRFSLDNDFPFYPGQEGMMIAVIEDDLDVSVPETQAPYACVSLAEKNRARYQSVIDALEHKKCFLKVSGAGRPGDDPVKNCSCFVAFVDRDYIAGGAVSELRAALKADKKVAVCVMEACDLPEDLARLQDMHQLRYDTGSREERLTKIANWLADQGCRDAYYIEDFEYSVTEEGICLTGYQGNKKDIVVEDSYGGIPVISVGEAFAEKDFIESVSLPDTVTGIDHGAFFRCRALRRVCLPDSLTKIGGGAFCECSSLEQIALPSKLTKIEAHTFRDCSSLLNVKLPDSVSSIGDQAFAGCTSLTEAALGAGVRSIAYGVFRYCGKLQRVDIPDQLEEIGRHVFDGCEELVYHQYDNALYLGNDKNPYVVLVRRVSDEISSVSIPEGTRVICEYAFRNCGNLTAIHIPDSVRFIGEQAFENCLGLTEVHFPENLRQLGISAFYGCTRLKEAILTDGLEILENGVFGQCVSLEYVKLPARLKKKSETTFKGCSKVRFKKKKKWLFFV